MLTGHLYLLLFIPQKMAVDDGPLANDHAGGTGFWYERAAGCAGNVAHEASAGLWCLEHLLMKLLGACGFHRSWFPALTSSAALTCLEEALKPLPSGRRHACQHAALYFSL